MWMDEEGHGWTWMDKEGHGGTRVGHVCAITQYCSDSRSQVERRRGCRALPARTRRGYQRAVQVWTNRLHLTIHLTLLPFQDLQDP